MPLEPFEEGLGQSRCLCEQAALGVIVFGLKEDGTIHNVLVRQAKSVALPDFKREAAATDAFRLLADNAQVLATDWDSHAGEPLSQAFSEHHFPAAGPERLRLQVEKYQPRSASKGHTDVDRLAARATPHTGLDDEAVGTAFRLPAFVVRQPPMRQGSLTPAAIEEADAPILVSHIGGCSLDDLAVEVELQGCLPPLGPKDIVHFAHCSKHTAFGRRTCRALWKQQLLGKIFDSCTGSGLPKCTG